MPRDTHEITRDDIILLQDYESIRKDKRQESILRKKFRRIAIGPYATIQFESWESMWLQIQEMLRIEKGGEEQLTDELAAYNPMVPNGSEFTGTLMFEIDEEERRTAFLKTLGGVDRHIHLVIGGEKVTAEQARIWKNMEGQVMVQIDHPNYGHAAIISDECRRDMARDLD